MGSWRRGWRRRRLWTTRAATSGSRLWKKLFGQCLNRPCNFFSGASLTHHIRNFCSVDKTFWLILAPHKSAWIMTITLGQNSVNLNKIAYIVKCKIVVWRQVCHVEQWQIARHYKRSNLSLLLMTKLLQIKSNLLCFAKFLGEKPYTGPCSNAAHTENLKVLFLRCATVPNSSKVLHLFW